MRIDAHQHYWKIARGDYGWIGPELPILYRDYGPADLKPHLDRHRLDGTIVVQAAPTLEETEYLLELAEKDETILGVVGWLDPNDPNHLEHYERFAGYPKFVGFRVMIQEMPDANAVLEPGFVEALRIYADMGVPVDLLVKSHQLDPLVRLIDLVPDLRGVIDHLAKPRIAAGELEPWRSRMSELAANPNLYCKISGLATEADHSRWKTEDFRPYIRHALEAFGPKRVLFGSDWPVCRLAAEYDQVVDIVEKALPDGWGEEERARLYGLNAKEFYRI
ncbi:amidohydrolase [Cohnella xylanilytica]|uniref:amidohydrolase family protein n=1 Tax=Cohnella xylanilytica TaxID=557555 RepID=UPI001B216E2E|nr:amidohydrolase family protein [Cohnella xylanilytica]GIO11877.1 amidohydrolase [Cohnella xylanilytica]